MTSLWNVPVKKFTANVVKQMHSADMQVDRKLQWQMRRAMNSDGLISNLFPVDLDASVNVWKYDMQVTRSNPRHRSREMGSDSSSPPTEAQPNAPSAQTTARASWKKPTRFAQPPARLWRHFSQLFSRHQNVPPMVRVQNSVYTTAPMPDDLLELPREFMDVGWSRCSLVPKFSGPFADLDPKQARLLANRLLVWALRATNDKNTPFSLVREIDGKMVCTDMGMSVSGLRIFTGTVAGMIFVEGVSRSASAKHKQQGNAKGEEESPFTSTVLSQLGVGLHHGPVPVRCVRKLNSFTFKEKKVESYIFKDAKVQRKVTFWDPPAVEFVPGGDYILHAVSAKKTPQKFVSHFGDIELSSTSKTVVVDSQATKQPREVAPAEATADVPQKATDSVEEKGEPQPAATTEVAPEAPNAEGQLMTKSNMPTVAPGSEMALKLDTRCTVASETNLWEEIKAHYGPPPYDEEHQQKITRVVRRTPVLLSLNLVQVNVRDIRFDVASPDDVKLEPHILALKKSLDLGQPYAVLRDFTVVPVQLLHCCFDPRIQSWTDVTVPACSFFPQRRQEILSKFREALCAGLRQWGITLGRNSWSTDRVKLLTEPLKMKRADLLKSGKVVLRPRSFAFVTINAANSDAREKENTMACAQALASYFKADTVMATDGEEAALHAAMKVLVDATTAKLKTTSCAAVFITKDPHTAATRWLVANAMVHGVLPIVLKRRPLTEARQKLLCGNVLMQLEKRFAVDPLLDLRLDTDVPELNGKTTVVVGIDACHTPAKTIIGIVAIAIGPTGKASVGSTFYNCDYRGHEVDEVPERLAQLLTDMCRQGLGGNPQQQIMDHIIIFQDGRVAPEPSVLKQMVETGLSSVQGDNKNKSSSSTTTNAETPTQVTTPSIPTISVICLHKRTNVRFIGMANQNHGNAVRGSVVEALAPPNEGNGPPSFYLQTHDCHMSTARTVQYVVQHMEAPLTPEVVQRLSYVLAHAGSPRPTKLPLPTRCAHRLAFQAERLIDACPEFEDKLIPAPLRNRLWFL